MCAQGPPKKHAPHTMCAPSWQVLQHLPNCTLALIPMCHCTPRDAYSVGATIPAVLRTTSAHCAYSMCLYTPRGTISASATVPYECAPSELTRSSPLHATAVPRTPAMHQVGKSLPKNMPRGRREKKKEGGEMKV